MRSLNRLLLPVVVLAAAACNDGNITTGNTPPSATILAPSDGSLHSSTVAMELQGVVGDSGSPASDLRVTWTATPGGVLYDGPPDDDDGNTTFRWEAPAIGETVVALSVLDPDGLSASQSIRLDIIGNTNPTCAITSPAGDGEPIEAGEVLLQGQVDDEESAADTLTFQWESDLDGELASGTADTAGVVSTTATLSPGTHALTLRIADPLGGTCTASISQPVNGAPSAPEIAFDPPVPTTLDDLRVVIVTPSEDPELSDVSYTYAWTEDGGAAAVSGDVVLSAELDKSEVWAVEVVGFDSEGFSSPPVSASVTIANSPPSAPTVSVAPLAPTQALDLVCAVDTPSTDPDGDGVTYAFAWEVDGAATGLTGDTLPWDETATGEFWTCVATPSDGEDPGPDGVATVQVTAGCASLDLDATTGAATVPDDVALRLASGDFTLEAWVRPGAFGTGETSTIVSKRGAVAGDGFHFGIGGLTTSSLGRPVFQVSDTTGDVLTGSVSADLNDWNHVAVTYDSGSGLATMWLNGLNVGSGAVAQPSNGTADFTIGADANGGGLVFDGHLDDVRVSDVVRYSAPFVPASQLSADGDTVAWWGFEEGSGATAKDLGGSGLDAALSGSAAFDGTQSTCANDQPPTAPVVVITPDHPLLSEDPVCSLVTASVDPEGATVTYAGQWLLNGAPSGQTFTSFPSILPSALTSEGDEWTCSVSASDGGQSGPAGTDAVFTGAMPIGVLAVPTPGTAASASIPFTAPRAGLVRATVDNPDASRDGVFTIDLLGYGTTWLFTGYRDWAYLGQTVAGWATTDLEFNLDPSLGSVTFALDYDPTAGIDNTGPDSLTLMFVYDTQLETNGATTILTSAVDAQDTTATSQQQLMVAGERLLIETVACGFGGGGHGIYADVDNVPGNDGIARVDTGFAGNCSIPLQSRPITAGSWTFTATNEDDFFTDNTGNREVVLYRYVP